MINFISTVNANRKNSLTSSLNKRKASIINKFKNLKIKVLKKLNLFINNIFKKGAPFFVAIFLLVLVTTVIYSNETSSKKNKDLSKYLSYPNVKKLIRENKDLDIENELSLIIEKEEVDSSVISNTETREDKLASNTPIIPSDDIIRSGQNIEYYTEIEIENEMIVHKVEDGETIESISIMYGVTPQTILASNDLENANLIKPGKTLYIMPITDAILHTVRYGETLSSIAKIHDVAQEKIIAFNEINKADDIKEGIKLIIPDSILVYDEEKRKLAFADPEPQTKKDTNTNKVSQNTNKTSYSSQKPTSNTVSSQGYFRPVSGVVLRARGIHSNNGIDISNNDGAAVHALASGTVTHASCATGSYWAYGCFIDISHPNGTSSRYAHLARGGIYVSVGQRVSGGQVIGKVGSTGRSTGPHLHFELHGATNPYTYLW